MSLRLDIDTKPAGLTVFSSFTKQSITVGQYEIGFRDFMELAKYVLTNTDLGPGDPRIEFVQFAKRLTKVEGYKPGGERLEPCRLRRFGNN